MIITVGLRVFLTIVLLISAVAKLLSSESFRTTLKSLGYSSISTNFVLKALPVTEIVIGVLVVWQPSCLEGEVGLFILLGGFLWVSWRAVVRKKSILCNCFGNLVPESFGWKTIVRILVMLVMDLYLIFYGNGNIANVSMLNLSIIIFMTLGIVSIYALLVTVYNYKHHIF